jgi:hypothetical protein
VDNNRNDLLSDSDTPYLRTLRLGPNEALPADSAPSLAIEHTFRLPKGGDLTLGPIILGAYKGDSMAGIAQIAQIRSHILHFPRPLPALASEPFIARHSGPQSDFTKGPLTQGWKVALLSDYSVPILGDYTAINEAQGGSAGLKKAIEELHQAGGKVLFVLDGSKVSKESIVGRGSGVAWAIRDREKKPLEENGNYLMCPSNAKWQDWLYNTAARLLRLYGADGIALTGLAGASTHPCFSAEHGHQSPYAWAWGVRRFFKTMRERLIRDFPNAVLVSDGALDLVREPADAMVADTHALTGYRFEVPMLRAVYPSIWVYEDSHAPDAELAERLRAWNVGQGLPLANSSSSAPPPPRRLYEAYPDVLDAPYFQNQPSTPTRDVVARILAGREIALTVGNLSDEPFSGAIRLPFKATALVDKLSGLRIEPNDEGAFPIALLARQGTFLQVEVGARK